MKKILRTLLCALLTVVLVCPTMGHVEAATTIKSGDWSYQSNGMGTVAIVGYSNLTEKRVTIPSMLNGYVVTEIGQSVFSNKTRITSVTIPNTITKIGNGAFCGCSGISSITIPRSVETFGYGTFDKCNNLKNVYIEGNPNLTYVSLGTTPKTIYAYRNASKVIAYCNTYKSFLTLRYSGDKMPFISVPQAFIYRDGSSVWTVDGTNATIMKYCGNYSCVTVPEKVFCVNGFMHIRAMGSRVFENNSTVNTITINVPQIYKEAIYNCTNLKNIKLGSNVGILHSYAIKNCNHISSVDFNNRTMLSDHAIDRVTGLCFYCPSYATSAIDYAKKNSISYVIK